MGSTIQNSVAVALANEITDVFEKSDDPNIEDMYTYTSGHGVHTSSNSKASWATG